MLVSGVNGPAANACGKLTTLPTGVKSVVVSYLMLRNTAGCTTIAANGTSMRVLPSGAASLTTWLAMRPPAPGRFSTNTGVPSTSFILSAMERAVTSAEPPAGNPTRIRTGAWAQAVWANTKASPNKAWRNSMVSPGEG